MFTPQVLNYFGIDEARFQSYTNTQKQDLIEARNSLFLFLKATQKTDSDLSPFLGQGLRTSYKSRSDLLSKLVGQEIEIQNVAITEF